MRRSRWFLMFSFLLLLMMTSSCFRPWRVIRKDMPRPYPVNSRFVILPISFQDARINGLSRGDYMARKNSVDRGKWNRIIAEMRDLFAENMRSYARDISVRIGDKARPGELTIDTHTYAIQTGFYAALVNRASHVQLRVVIRKGKDVYDEFVINSGTNPTAGNSILPAYPSIASRLRRDATILGRYAGRYLRVRLDEKIKK